MLSYEETTSIVNTNTKRQDCKAAHDSAAPTMKCRVSRHTRAKMELVLNFMVVISLVAFDIRDLWFKIVWLGPYDTFHFKGYPSYYRLRPTSLELAVNLTDSGEVFLRPNGWSSFLEKCATLTVLGGHSRVFRIVLAQNCTVGPPNASQIVPSLVLTSSIRSDSVAWACCQLLDLNRQPSICSAHIVRDFERRYNMETPKIPFDWIARPGSDAEDELMAVLEVIGKSSPIHQVTCVEGFEYKGPGRSNATIFGCGAPNYFQSAFAGVYATRLRELQHDKGYLTMDNINAMGFRYGIRENCISAFEALSDPSDGTLIVSHTSTINFTVYGQLYALQLIIDMMLMLLNALSALQIGARLVIPVFRLKDPESVKNFIREGYARFLACTLYRSHMVMAMVAISQLLSWLLILPSAVIWNWGNSTNGKIQAYLSSLRIWALVLIIVNVLWDTFVFWHERLAYRIVKYTFIAPVEIALIVAGVSYWNRVEVFGVGELKVALENQRMVDRTSFKGAAGTSNAFSLPLDYQLNTPTEVLWIIYKPFFRIILISILIIAAHVTLRFAFFYWNPLGLTLERRFIVTNEATLVVDTRELNQHTSSSKVGADTVSSRKASKRRFPSLSAPSRRKGASITPAPPCGLLFTHSTMNSRKSRELDSFVVVTAPTNDANLLDHEYCRLPLEVLLNRPIRARSLVRFSLTLDQFVNEKQYVFAPLTLEFGVYFLDGRMKSRWGFLNPIPPVVQVDHTVVSDKIQSLIHGKEEGEQQQRQLQSVKFRELKKNSDWTA